MSMAYRSAFAFLIAVSSLAAQDGKRVAFLVGVNEYKSRTFPDLQYAENDAKELAAELSRMGFAVKTLLGGNATRAAIEAELLKQLDGATKKDVVLVSLCGHGVQQTVDGKDDAFFCPYDALLSDPKTLFSLSRLTDVILHERGGKNLVLVDACRDEPNDPNRGMRGVQGKVVALPEDTQIFFAARAGQRSFESKELGHGLFTHAVLTGLRKGVGRGETVTWSGLVDHVQEAMDGPDYLKHLPTGRSQVPISAGQMSRVVLGRIAALKSNAAMSTAKRNWLQPLGIKSKEEAAKVLADLRKDADAGDVGAMVRLGHTLHVGDNWSGVDKSLAVEYARKSAASNDPIAMMVRASIELEHCPPNREIGLHLNEWMTVMETSADSLRERSDLPSLATVYVGICLKRGPDNVPAFEDVNRIDAVRRFRAAAEKGEAHAFCRLGRAHWDGDGVKGDINEDFNEGSKLIVRAAELGNAEAMVLSYYAYSQGRGVTKDKAKADEWLRRAADQKQPTALQSLNTTP